MTNKTKGIIIGSGVMIVMLVFIFALSKKDEEQGVSSRNGKNILEPLKIGFITDAHCYAKQDKETSEWSMNWRCVEPMQKFVEKMNTDFKPVLVVEGGDFVDGKDDRSEGSFADAKKMFDQAEAPKFHVLGNHEVRGFDKQKWLELTEQKETYYHYDTDNGYRVIVLDGNNKPIKDGSVDAGPEIEFYPGFIDSDQKTWLEDVLKDSEEWEVVVFVHQPLFATDAKMQNKIFVGGKELRELFSRHKVRAVFSGHIERVCNLKEDGVEYFALQGFWKGNQGLKEEFQFEKGGVFSEITVLPDDVRVVMHHRRDRELPYENFEITPENSSCFDGSTLAEGEEEINE